MKVSIIGSGNVAYHLALQLSRRDCLLEVRSKNIQTGSEIANTFHVPFYSDITEVSDSCEVVIIAVSDDAIEKVAQNLKVKHQIVVHTSGYKSMDLLQSIGLNYGSFYPLQTFTKNRAVNFDDIPILVDASNEASKRKLLILGNKLSHDVRICKDAERSQLHVAAVIVNNFTNHLLALAKDYCHEKQLDFDVLQPLIKETYQKALMGNPKEIQTGPAKRNDTATIAKHLEELANEQLKALYRNFTQSIQKMYEKA